MHIRLLAVGDRQPPWVDTAFAEYTARLPRPWQFRLETIAIADRRKAATPARAKAAEADKLLAKLKPAEQVILLDETGRQFTSRELSKRVGGWQAAGADVAVEVEDVLGEAAEELGNLGRRHTRARLGRRRARTNARARHLQAQSRERQAREHRGWLGGRDQNFRTQNLLKGMAKCQKSPNS